MHIDHYEFGAIVIDGHTYRNDLLLWPGQIKTDWWRQEGHLLQLVDVTAALDANPQVLVVGLGAYGRMEVDAGLRDYLQQHGIDLIAKPTPEAVPVINELSGKRRLAAALHLTC